MGCRLFSRLMVVSLVVSIGALSPTAAGAEVQMTQRGSVAFLESSHLDRGDEETFAQFLSSPGGASVKIIYLDSRGGNTAAAIAIGRMIRKHGLDTAYHVGRGRCVSACTTIFLGGVHRYYVGGSQVADGVATHVGMGFHPSNGSQGNEERISSYYSEMGVPEAAKVRYKLYRRDSVGGNAPLNADGEPEKYKLFFISGKLALQTGVATSVEEPADAALRDEP
jgi:hypothetical protein